MLLALGISALIALGLLVCWLPHTPSLADEERELREYFRKRDAADRRGERFPP